MGGLSGHMHHPIDVMEFSKDDLKNLISELFTGNIKFTEKIDGFNIHASKHQLGTPIFFRNNTDLKSDGMGIGYIAEKYKYNYRVFKIFTEAALIISEFLEKVNFDFIDYTGNYKYTINCECVSAGVTNIMYYNKTAVYLHNIWKWKKQDDKWVVDNIYEIPKEWREFMNDSIKCSQILGFNTKHYDNYIVKYYQDKIDEIFGETFTLLEYYQIKFLTYINKNEPWILKNYDGTKILFNRFFLNDKSTDLKKIKKIYPNDPVDQLCQYTYKEIIKEAKDIDILFLNLGNDIISRVNGYINENNPYDAINNIKQKLTKINICPTNQHQFFRWQSINEIINPVEGVVFTYKDHLLKLTGSFAPINQLIGGQRQIKKHGEY